MHDDHPAAVPVGVVEGHGDRGCVGADGLDAEQHRRRTAPVALGDVVHRGFASDDGDRAMGRRRDVQRHRSQDDLGPCSGDHPDHDQLGIRGSIDERCDRRVR